MSVAVMTRVAEMGSLNVIRERVERFVCWLDHYGETSYDHQSFFASRLGRAAKALYYRRPLLGAVAVSPMILCEAFLPSARRLFWKRQRLPIADAHYAMGFAYLYRVTGEEKYYHRAVHFLEVLKESRCPGYKHYCWGYPFNWETRGGTIPEQTPLITTVPYVYEAFEAVYSIDHETEWRDIMRSIADHSLYDYRDFETCENASTCSYTPQVGNPGGVINASAYRAFLLTAASIEFSHQDYRDAARRNLQFVVDTQNADGSWYYSVDGERDFVDHFHTCFVLKALAKIEAATGNAACTRAIARGVDYYVHNLLDDRGLPKPFSVRPRLTVYRRELYDYAESINLAVLLDREYPALHDMLARVLEDLAAWQKADDSFRCRQLLLGWDNTPMHRWALSQLFRSLCLFLYQSQCQKKTL